MIKVKVTREKKISPQIIYLNFKVFLCMEKGIILPNKNYKVPRDGMDALISKRMIVVDEVTPWPDNVGIAG